MSQTASELQVQLAKSITDLLLNQLKDSTPKQPMAVISEESTITTTSADFERREESQLLKSELGHAKRSLVAYISKNN